MPSSRVTIRDVARLAQVSRQTVSRVINGEGHIRPETRERVLSVIEQLDFVPSQIARSLVTKRTHMVGLVVGDIGNPYFSDVARGAEAVLAPAGWSLVLANADFDPDKEAMVVDHLISKSVDGLIICDTRTAVEDLATLAHRMDLPMVFVNRATGGSLSANLGVVRTDRRKAAFEAVAHLVGLGHRRIGLLISERSTPAPESRLRGYREALASFGIPFDPALVVRGKLSIEGGYQASSQLLDLDTPSSAVLCHNDLMAIGLMKACAERGVGIPRDLSIIGWDDTPYASVVSPPLTTVRMPRFELGWHAADMLLKLIKRCHTDTDIELPTVLIHRESCAPVGS